MKEAITVIAVILAMHLTTFAGPLDRDPQPQGVAFAINGKFYHDLELVSVQSGIAEFNSKEGKISAPWSSLPAAFQKSHANEKTELEKSAAAAKVEAETPKMHIQVIQVLPNGVLADLMKEEFVSWGKSNNRVFNGGAVSGGDGVVYHPSGKMIFVAGIAGEADGGKLGIRAKRDGTYTDGKNTVEKWIFTEKLKE